MDTPFEREVEPRLLALRSVEEARGFVRWYVLLARFGADLDLEGIAAMIGKAPVRIRPDNRPAYNYLQDAIAELCCEGTLRPGPRTLFDTYRASGLSVTLAGEAWLPDPDATNRR